MSSVRGEGEVKIEFGMVFTIGEDDLRVHGLELFCLLAEGLSVFLSDLLCHRLRSLFARILMHAG
jgi:hypothetical protein